MTPEPIKALAELRALSDAATPGPWRRLITARTVQVTAGDRPVAKFARLADAAFIPALVNAFRADPDALLSLVPQDGLYENPDAKALLDGFHLTDRNMDAMNAALSRTFPIYSDEEAGTDLEGDTITMLDALMDNGYVVVNFDAIRATILNRDTGSAEPELRCGCRETRKPASMTACPTCFHPQHPGGALTCDLTLIFGGSAEPGEGPVE